MLKVKNLGNKFCSISAGIVETGATVHLPVWEVRVLLRANKQDLQFIMDEK